MLVMVGLHPMIRAQHNIPILKETPYDSSKKDWSCLDRLYIISKVIHPQAVIYPRADTVTVIINVPDGALDSSTISYRRDAAFNAIAYVSLKDSMRFKFTSLELCESPYDCKKAFYVMSKQKLPDLSFNEWLASVAPSFYWPSESIIADAFDNTKTIILHHKIDTADQNYSQGNVRIFTSYVDMLINDKVHKSKASIQKLYKKVLHIFYCGETLLCQSHYYLDERDFPAKYGYQLWMSFQKNYGL
jgi:hypothetical protein